MPFITQFSNFFSFTISTNSNFPYWVSGTLKKLINLKNKAYAAFKSFFDALDYQVFSQFRAKCKRESKKSFKDFNSKAKSTSNYNTKMLGLHQEKSI